MPSSNDTELCTHRPVVGSTPYQELDAKPGYSQRYSSTAGKVTGIIQFICGVVALILGSTALFLRLTFSISCIGIWAGVVFFALSGILGIISSKRQTGVIVGYMVMSILSAIVAFSAASVYTSAMVTSVPICDLADYIDMPIDTYIGDPYDSPVVRLNYDWTDNGYDTDSESSDSSYDSVFGFDDDELISYENPNPDLSDNAVGIFVDKHDDVEVDALRNFNVTFDDPDDDDYVVNEQEAVGGPHYYYETELFSCKNRQADLAVNSLLVVVFLVEFVVAIVGSGFTCGGVCCCGSSSPVTTSINVTPGNACFVPVQGGWPVTAVQGCAAFPPQQDIQNQEPQKI